MHAPDSRRIFVWHGKNPAEDTSRLTEAVAEAAVTELFAMNEGLFWLDAGKPVPVNKDVLRKIITRHIVSLRLVNRGEFGLEREFFSFDFPLVADTSKEPSERVLIDMIAALVGRVARGPSTPRTLTPQRELEARARLKMGERPDRIADAYGVDVDTIRDLVG